MFVARLTPMPEAPLISRLGTRDGRTIGSCRLSEKLGWKSTVFFSMSARMLAGDAGHARFGVAHGRGRVAVDAAEVALAVDQRVAQSEVLGHAHERVVDRRVAVGVVLAHDLTDDGGALLVGVAGRKVQLGHRVEDAALHRLQAVAHVRDGARRR